ncbi:MAG: carotenoid 1,2-hydratase [Burkholderiaceae bacterium]
MSSFSADSSQLSSGLIEPVAQNQALGADSSDDNRDRPALPPESVAPPYPDFDLAVPDAGYAWWYADGISDDGRHAVTLIAFVGSVFSPYYASARRRPPAPAEQHCALNVAIYSPVVGRWAMTERAARHIQRSSTEFVIGPSRVSWQPRSTGQVSDGNSHELVFEINERSAPFGKAVKGEIRVTPSALQPLRFSLDERGGHFWHPVAPRARMQVNFEQPDLQWSGNAYLDRNQGNEPLEAGFQNWTWMRASHADHTTVIYEVNRRGASPLALARRFDLDGSSEPIAMPSSVDLPGTGWRIKRSTRAEPPKSAFVVRTLEDTPFYSRSELSVQLEGQQMPAIHESLDLDRFASRWVQTLLPFRMPRRR